MAELYCFREAFIRTRPPQRSGNVPQISEEHGMKCLAAHMCGLRHKDNESRDVSLPVFDPIGNSIITLALSEEYQPLEGKTSTPGP